KNKKNNKCTIYNTKSDKKSKTYTINNDLAEFLLTFSDKYGISQTLLFNYAFQFKLKDYSRNMPKTNSDVKQLYLTQNSYDNLNIKGIRTFDVLDKQIRTLKSCLEKGEPMF